MAARQAVALAAILAVASLESLDSKSVVAQTCSVVETEKVSGYDTAAFDWFGSAVALDRDIAAIGAPNHNRTGSWDGKGAVYVFHHECGSSTFGEAELWSPGQKIVASDESWRFGSSVVARNDRILVAAIGDSRPIGGTGAVYVFRRAHKPDGLNEEDNWIEEAKLFPADAHDSDFFAWSGLSYDGDRAIVGAPEGGRSDGQDGPGAAYVFRPLNKLTPGFPVDDNWIEEAKLMASDGTPRDHFGYSVSISARWALVGAPHAWPGPDGVAYIYHLDDAGTPLVFDDDTWVEHTRLVSNEYPSGFGESVAINSRFAVIGAPGENAVYVYRHLNRGKVSDSIVDSWVLESRITDPSVWEFGLKVALHGDVVAIGAKIPTGVLCDPWPCGSGAVFFYRRRGTAWHLVDTAVSGVGPLEVSDEFPSDIAFNCNSAVIGARMDSSGLWSFDGAASFFSVGCADDCNNNGISDFCDLANGTSVDRLPAHIGGDGMPDECLSAQLHRKRAQRRR